MTEEQLNQTVENIRDFLENPIEIVGALGGTHTTSPFGYVVSNEQRADCKNISIRDIEDIKRIITQLDKTIIFSLSDFTFDKDKGIYLSICKPE